MKRLFSESFFHFVLGFIGMLALSLSLTLAINYYDGGGVEQTATVSDADSRADSR